MDEVSDSFPMSDDLFAPAGGWRVRIIDLTGGAEDNISEEVPGFLTLMHANAFARRYVRDSVEHCRIRGMSTKDVLEAWFAFGEDALVVDAGDGAWKSATEIGDFAGRPAGPEDRDWRSLDPRRDADGAGSVDDEDDE
jgi:hypothetical protein